MKALNQRLNFIGLSLLLGAVLPFSSLISLIIPQNLYVTRAVLISFSKNLLAFIIFSGVFKAPLKSLKFDRREINLLDLALLTVFAFVLCVSCNIVPNIVSHIVGIKTNSSYVFNPLDYLAVALFPAVIEELAFRQIITGGLSEYGTRFAVLVSALLFALSHTELTAVLYAFFCGIILACLYIRTCSIYACIIVHFLCNALTITCSIFENPNLCYKLAVMLSLALSLVLFVALRLKGIRILPQETQKSSVSLFKAFFTNAIIIILLVINVIMIVCL